MAKNDGGAAFPVPVYLNEYGVAVDVDARGITVLDYFAAKAMKAFACAIFAEGKEEGRGPFEMARDVATISYAQAAAMLAEKERVDNEGDPEKDPDFEVKDAIPN